MEEVTRQTNELLKKGLIRPSCSPYGAPVILVKKKKRWIDAYVCIDYRLLNSRTVKNRFPLPLIEDLLDAIVNATIFSKLDLLSGFHQVPMHEDDIEKTAFRTRHGNYEFTVMPFGLTNAPSTIMALMTDVLNDYINDFVVIFIDDILIYTKNNEQHEVHVSKVL